MATIESIRKTGGTEKGDVVVYVSLYPLVRGQNMRQACYQLKQLRTTKTGILYRVEAGCPLALEVHWLGTEVEIDLNQKFIRRY